MARNTSGGKPAKAATRAASAKKPATRRATANPATRAAKAVKANTPAAQRRLRAVAAREVEQELASDLDEQDMDLEPEADEERLYTDEVDDDDGEYEDDDADAAYDTLHEDEADEDEADEDDDDWADEERERPDDEYSAASYLQGQRIWLPSGGFVRVRPVSLIGLIKQGALPPNLLAAARKMVFGKASPTNANRAERRHGGPSSAEVSAQNSLAVIDHLCMAAVASFKLVDCKPGRERAGCVSIHAMIEADKMAIANYCMKGQTALRPFRG